MKRATLFFQIGAGCYFFVGVLHLGAYFAIGEEMRRQPIFEAMQAFPIELFGQHNLLQFYTGFSLLMGVLPCAFGIQNFLVSKIDFSEPYTFKRFILAATGTTLIVLFLTISYIHLLATAFVATALLFFTLALFCSTARHPA